MSPRDESLLNSTDLRYLLIDNLSLYTDNSFFVSWNNPYNFLLDKKSIYVYIKNIHDSWNWRPNIDEMRVQIWRSKNFNEALNSWKIVFILWYSNEYRVFTAWNPILFKERINLRKTVSKYTRKSLLEKAKEKWISLYIDNNWEKIISFRPEYIWLYFENYNEIHQSNEVALLELINSSDKIDSTWEKWKKINIDSEEFILTKIRVPRDPHFRKKVYMAYDYRCAITWIQLSIVEAAHIIPYSHDLGSDEVENWLCLSASYHTAYDYGLIYIDEEYNIRVNEEKLDYLAKIWQDWGFDKFRKIMYDKINLPKLTHNHPSKEYIKKANEIRWINYVNE